MSNGFRQTGRRKYALIQKIDLLMLKLTKKGLNPHAVIETVFNTTLTGIKKLSTKTLTGKYGELKQFAKANL